MEPDGSFVSWLNQCFATIVLALYQFYPLCTCCFLLCSSKATCLFSYFFFVLQGMRRVEWENMKALFTNRRLVMASCSHSLQACCVLRALLFLKETLRKLMLAWNFFSNSFEPGTKCARYDTTEVHCSVCVHFRSLFVFFSEGNGRSHYLNVRKVWF